MTLALSASEIGNGMSSAGTLPKSAGGSPCATKSADTKASAAGYVRPTEAIVRHLDACDNSGNAQRSVARSLPQSAERR